MEKLNTLEEDLENEKDPKKRLNLNLQINHQPRKNRYGGHTDMKPRDWTVSNTGERRTKPSPRSDQ